MFIIDSTRRADILMVTVDDWVRMMDEELLKYDVRLDKEDIFNCLSFVYGSI